jgi:hypothetical protein
VINYNKFYSLKCTKTKNVLKNNKKENDYVYKNIKMNETSPGKKNFMTKISQFLSYN